MILIARFTRHAAAVGGLLLLGAACSPTVSPAPSPSPSPGVSPVSAPRTAGMPPSPLVPSTWAVHTNEGVDLWLHSFAMLSPDTMLVPYFDRGYRDRMTTLRRNRNASSLLDTNRATLVA